MNELHDALGWVVAGVCLTALGIILFTALAFYVRRHSHEWLERAEWMRRHPSCLLAAPLVIALILYGGEKARIMFQFGQNLTDNGSWATNNTVCVKWLYDTRPGTDKVNISYRNYNEGGDYTLLAQVAASEYIWESEIVNATNYDYKIYFEAKTPDAEKETFVAQIDLTSDGERMIPVCVDIQVDGNGVFRFIPRPEWPTNTVNEVNELQMTEEAIEAFEASEQENESAEVSE